MTIVYHFEQRSNEQFFHDIAIDEHMLATQSTDEFVSHLYMAEAYYFNPKQVKRSQLLRLVAMLQQHHNQNNAAQNPEGTSPQQDGPSQTSQQKPAGRPKNFFERKRFINYENSAGESPENNRNL